MKPDACELMELARDLFMHSKTIHGAKTLEETRNKIIGAMAHLTPTGSLSLVPSIVDTVIEEETFAFASK